MLRVSSTTYLHPVAEAEAEAKAKAEAKVVKSWMTTIGKARKT
jgi:hypothetical protein